MNVIIFFVTIATLSGCTIWQDLTPLQGSSSDETGIVSGATNRLSFQMKEPETVERPTVVPLFVPDDFDAFDSVVVVNENGDTLPHYAESSGTRPVVWTRLPPLADPSTIHVYYGGDATQSTSTVFDDYVAVWLFDGTSVDRFSDVTAERQLSKPDGADLEVERIEGPHGDAIRFIPGENDFNTLESNELSGTNFPQENLSIEFMARLSALNFDSAKHIFGQGERANNIFMTIDSDGLTRTLLLDADEGGPRILGENITDEWVSYVVTCGSRGVEKRCQFYQDGIVVGDEPVALDWAPVSQIVTIGHERGLDIEYDNFRIRDDELDAKTVDLQFRAETNALFDAPIDETL